MQHNKAEVCCPRFDPKPWDEVEVTWTGKLFLAYRVWCFLHIPLNFGSMMKRNIAKIEAAGAKSDEMIVLSQDRSLWSADVYIRVTEEVPGAKMTTISGTFLSKAFEGPYSNFGKWIKDMKAYVQSKGKEMEKLYYFYTTCPKCAKKHGENHVVLLSQSG
jgi:Bacterial hydrolase